MTRRPQWVNSSHALNRELALRLLLSIDTPARRTTAIGSKVRQVTAELWAVAAESGAVTAQGSSVASAAPIAALVPTPTRAAVHGMMRDATVAMVAAPATLERPELTLFALANAVTVSIFVAITDTIAIRVAMAWIGPEEVFAPVVYTIVIGIDVESVGAQLRFDRVR